ncbi:hypothetical protein HMSSN036_82450 [Paenibacillus macerans]|nr:hypothetical protein HMSSN036_82450 [Paenibacillus macerans]
MKTKGKLGWLLVLLPLLLLLAGGPAAAASPAEKGLSGARPRLRSRNCPTKSAGIN